MSGKQGDPEEVLCRPPAAPTHKVGRRAADALLRDHPDAIIFAQTADGEIVPVPESLGLDGYPILSDEARTGVDLCVAEDRMAVVNAWLDVKKNGVAEARARLRSDPTVWREVHMLDLRARHGVLLTVGWISDQELDGAATTVESAVATSTPRFCTRKQDSEGNVIDCDEAYLQMFGYEDERQVVGRPTFEQLHPDDQARLIESWVAVIATGRPQMARVRMKRGDGSWLWVDVTYHSYLGAENSGYILAECIDVSGEMAAQEELQDREELLRRVLDEMPDGLLQLDRERRVIYHNMRLLELLQLPLVGPDDAGENNNRNVPTLESILTTLTEPARAVFDAAVAQALQGALSDDVELDISAHEDDPQRTLLFKVRPLTRDTGLVTGAIASVQDVTDSAQARRELEYRAASDPLTGSHNRASILAALSTELDHGRGVGLLYIDLDHFKEINDTLGHAAGDELLIQVTSRLRQTMRSGDELGRLGGDEFLVLLRNADGLSLVKTAGERISHALKGTYLLDGEPVELCASIGATFASAGSTSPDDLVARADKAMYRSKRERRGVPALAA